MQELQGMIDYEIENEEIRKRNERRQQEIKQKEEKIKEEKLKKMMEVNKIKKQKDAAREKRLAEEQLEYENKVKERQRKVSKNGLVLIILIQTKSNSIINFHIIKIYKSLQDLIEFQKLEKKREEDEKEQLKKQILQKKQQDQGTKETEDLFLEQQRELLEKQIEFDKKEEQRKKKAEEKRAYDIKMKQLQQEKVRQKIEKTMLNNDLILKQRREVRCVKFIYKYIYKLY